MAAARSASELGEALVYASRDNMIVDICRLLTQGADVNYVHRWMHEGKEVSTTPLIQAALNGHADAIRVLISRGAEVNKPEPSDGNTALHAAAQEGHLLVIELLMSKGARHDVRSNYGRTPLFQAAFKEAAICLLDHGADVNAKDNLRFTPLMLAAQEGHLPLVDLLVLRGADLDLANNEGATPLIKAAQNGRLEVIKFLVEKVAVVDQPANDGGTALDHASLDGHLDVVQFLLSAGANINHLDVKGMSPLYAAAQNGHIEVVKLLVKEGANINQASDLGITPLHQAAIEGHQEVVDYLIRKGSKFEARGTPAKACKCCGATDVPLKFCTGCGVICYCSPECQLKDWREGGENRHKVQCKRLVEIRASYVEKTKKEIEEKMARFGVSSSNAGNSGGGAGPSTLSGIKI